MGGVDVLVVAALQEEFAAARAVASAAGPDGPGVHRWEERTIGASAPHLYGEYRASNGQRLSVALARPTHMGGRETGPIAATLTSQLEPLCLAMCGVCAGNPSATALGDVVVADPVYQWDEGKRSGGGFVGDHRQLRLDPRLVRIAQDFDPTSVPSYGAATVDEAMLWLLERLHLKQDPRTHPARARYFPAGTWQPCLERFAADGLIWRDAAGVVSLTRRGVALVRRRLYDDVDGPRQLPFQVLVSPMASGNAVVADPAIWTRLMSMGMRKIAAVEMEAATIATVAHQWRVPYCLVVKGVMDSADARKDDRYKQFAAKVSAEVMFALLVRSLPDLRRPPDPPATRVTDGGGREPLAGPGPVEREPAATALPEGPSRWPGRWQRLGLACATAVLAASALFVVGWPFDEGAGSDRAVLGPCTDQSQPDIVKPGSTREVFSEFCLNMDPGLGYEIDQKPGEASVAGAGYEAGDPGASSWDLYLSDDDPSLYAIDPPGGGPRNLVQPMPAAAVPTDCRKLARGIGGGGIHRLTGLGDGAKLCHLTYQGHWAMLQIVRKPGGSFDLLRIYVVVLTT